MVYTYSFPPISVGFWSFPVGIGDNGTAALCWGRSIRDDGLSARWISTGSTKTLSGWTLRRNGSLLARSRPGSSNVTSVTRLSPRISRRSRWFHLNDFSKTNFRNRDEHLVLQHQQILLEMKKSPKFVLFYHEAWTTFLPTFFLHVKKIQKKNTNNRV